MVTFDHQQQRACATTDFKHTMRRLKCGLLDKVEPGGIATEQPHQRVVER
jgi:hypothetical protein